MELACDLPEAPVQIAVVLMLGSAATVELAAITETIGRRLSSVPRLRQRLVRPPLGGGRPIWVDDAGFDVRRHVHAVRCPAPGDETALLAVVADTLARRLPADRPLWSATLVTPLADGNAALVVMLHHVVADGIGGLAVLAQLVDGVPPAPATAFPRPAPGYRALLRDALGTRLRALARLPAGTRKFGVALTQLAAGGTDGPPPSSLNQPTGGLRSLAVARADLAAVRRAAHEQGATVNDIVLTAVTGALRDVLRGRGERMDRFVVSVPASTRGAATAAQLGNQVGVMLVPVIVRGDQRQRLAAIAHTTRTRKVTAAGSSAAVLGPAFRALAWLGLMRWFVNHQRLVTTFVTNVRGPHDQLSFLGAPVTAVIPVSSIAGNVTVSFTVLSYAGTLVITAMADLQSWPDLPFLVAHLQRELDLLAQLPERAA